MKQLDADALIISALLLSWLCGALAAYFWLTIQAAMKNNERRQDNEELGEEFEYSERPFYQGY